jgi:hypothetical protein
MNTKRKDYNDVYTDCSDFGFLFYKDEGLNESIPLSREQMIRISMGKGNGDKLFVVCGPCDLFMDFESGDDELGGCWICPECGARVEEQEVYIQLDKENDEFLKEHDLDYDDFYEL